MNQTTIAIIQGVITILSAGGVAVILRQQIKSQQEQINAMKANMDSMKAFIDIFKIDELHKYVDTMKRTLDAERNKIMIDSAKAGAEAMQKELEEKVIKGWKETSEKIFSEYKSISEENLELKKIKGNQKVAIEILVEKAGLDIEEVHKKINSDYDVYSIKDM